MKVYEKKVFIVRFCFLTARVNHGPIEGHILKEIHSCELTFKVLRKLKSQSKKNSKGLFLVILESTVD